MVLFVPASERGSWKEFTPKRMTAWIFSHWLKYNMRETSFPCLLSLYCSWVPSFSHLVICDNSLLTPRKDQDH